MKYKNIITFVKIHHEIIGPAGAGPARPTPTPLYIDSNTFPKFKLTGLTEY